MLKDRIISAVFLLLIFLASYLSKKPTYFLSLILVASGILFYELAKILKLKSLSLYVYWILSLAPIIFFYFLIGLDIFFLDNSIPNLKSFLINFSIFISLISLFFWFGFAPLDIIYKKISSNVKFKIFYGYFLVSPMVIVTAIVFTQNKVLLLVPFIMIWISDIGAFFIGKKFGKNKLAKNISPGKTIEGALGGFLCNIICASILAHFFAVSFYIMLFFATIITALSIFGDIYQSFLKRQANLKDSGSILPGHGGLFDRLDSFCPTIPIFFLLCSYLYIEIPPKLIL
ncbi:MAG: phosphatidate cytidylyltransferase [Methylophilaceae bacterium]|nr:phosphatidate cytidylyltransferase [Methylophilaceae bacterium]